MFFVDHFSVSGIFKRTFAELNRNLFFEFVDQSVVNFLRTQNIIGRDAGLTEVEELAPYDALCRKSDIRRFVHDARALSAEFQRHGGQVFRRMRINELPHPLAARKENIVETGLHQFGVHLRTAEEYRNVFGREYAFDYFLDRFVRVGRICAEF